MGVSKSWKQGPDGGYFTPEGAMVWPDEGTVVVADLHLGYEATRAKSGDYLPELSLNDVQKRLAGLFVSMDVKRLVVAGDVTESSAAMRGRQSVLHQFQTWLEDQGIESILIAGNHDHQVNSTAFFQKSYVVQGWLVHHGHQPMDRNEDGLKGQITGHLHPVMKWQGRTFRAFLSSPGQIILPAFSGDAAGLDLLTSGHFQDSNGDSSCWICSDTNVLEFGSIRNLRSKLGLS